MQSRSERARRSGPAAVVLSAGASERFGGMPKAASLIDGVPAVARIARLCAEAGCAPVIVVAGLHSDEVRRLVEGESVQLVFNPAWQEGRTGSLQVGMQTAPQSDEFLVWPVDHPFVNAMTVGALLRTATRDSMAVWFVPTFGGRGGHPVLVRGEAVRRIFGLRRDAPLRSLLPGLGLQVARIAVSDPGVVRNVDTQSEFSRASAEFRSGE